MTNFDGQGDEQRASIRPLKRHFVRMKLTFNWLKKNGVGKVHGMNHGGFISFDFGKAKGVNIEL